MDHAAGCRLKRPMNGFVAYSDSTVDKVNFVIFVIKPLLLDFQVDKTTRAARHLVCAEHINLLPQQFKSSKLECEKNTS